MRITQTKKIGCGEVMNNLTIGSQLINKYSVWNVKKNKTKASEFTHVKKVHKREMRLCIWICSCISLDEGYNCQLFLIILPETIKVTSFKKNVKSSRKTQIFANSISIIHLKWQKVMLAWSSIWMLFYFLIQLANDLKAKLEFSLSTANWMVCNQSVYH